MSVKIKYVGLQSPHRERLYGTKTLFEGPGDVKEFEEKIGQKMLSNHPDQYADAADETAPDNPAGSGDPGQGGGSTETPEREILVDGEYKKLSACTKDQLEVFAKENFGVDLDKRKKVADLAAEVVELIAKAEQAQ